jgi:hypothetical protein
MGRKKGKNIYWLTTHVLVYTMVMTLCWKLFFGFFERPLSTMFLFGAITFLTHWVTDYVTSKFSGYYYLKRLENEKSRNVKKTDFYEWAFWLVIGVDQFIHAFTLILTYKYLY